jgi:hypothetical protein
MLLGADGSDAFDRASLRFTPRTTVGTDGDNGQWFSKEMVDFYWQRLTWCKLLKGEPKHTWNVQQQAWHSTTVQVPEIAGRGSAHDLNLTMLWSNKAKALQLDICHAYLVFSEAIFVIVRMRLKPLFTDQNVHPKALPSNFRKTIVL